jgi:hypothetical protein
MGGGLELGVGVGAVATGLSIAVSDDKVLHHRQVLVVAVGTLERAGLDGLQGHGEAGGEAAAVALGELRGIALLKPGHTPERGEVLDRASS